MKSICIKKTLYSYSANKLIDNGNYQLEILADWFTDDVGSWIPSWREWLNDRSEEAETTESNATWLEKDWLPNGACNITFGSITDLVQAPREKVFVPKAGSTISIPRENVIELFNTWENLLKNGSNEIMIVEEDGVYKMFEVQ